MNLWKINDEQKFSFILKYLLSQIIKYSKCTFELVKILIRHQFFHPNIKMETYKCNYYICTFGRGVVRPEMLNFAYVQNIWIKKALRPHPKWWEERRLNASFDFCPKVSHFGLNPAFYNTWLILIIQEQPSIEKCKLLFSNRVQLHHPCEANKCRISKQCFFQS